MENLLGYSMPMWFNWVSEIIVLLLFSSIAFWLFTLGKKNLSISKRIENGLNTENGVDINNPTGK